jgi:hypothetical protein
MRIPTWRIALTGAAVVVLAVAGIGFAAAATSTPPAVPNVAAAAPSASPSSDGSTTGGPLAGLRAKLREARLLKLGRHLVHAVATVTDKDGNLITFQLDHGTVQAIGSGTLTIAEAGGGTETVSTDDATIVRTGKTLGKLGDVKVGAEVFVQSRVDGGTTLAKRILVVPAAAS